MDPVSYTPLDVYKRQGVVSEFPTFDEAVEACGADIVERSEIAFYGQRDKKMCIRDRDNLTGRENILLPTSLHGVSEAESSQRLKDVYKRQTPNSEKSAIYEIRSEFCL